MVLDKRAGKGQAARGGFCPRRPQARGPHGLCPDVLLLHPAAPTTETAPGEGTTLSTGQPVSPGGLLAHHNWGPEEAPAGGGGPWLVSFPALSPMGALQGNFSKVLWGQKEVVEPARLWEALEKLPLPASVLAGFGPWAGPPQAPKGKVVQGKALEAPGIWVGHTEGYQVLWGPWGPALEADRSTGLRMSSCPHTWWSGPRRAAPPLHAQC
nr:uncharacterized protein LOC129464073 [Symphalangus syndactylus]